jgi:hypothetical protein
MIGGVAPLEGIDEVPWATLQCAYGEGYRIPSLLRRLAAEDHNVVEKGWEEVNEQILWHQGTIYPATVAAVPFVARIAGMPTARRRARLISLLADFSVGRDVPHAPDGTLVAVRNAVRESLPIVTQYVDTTDRPLALAMAQLAAAMPFDLPAAQASVLRRLGTEIDTGVRRALAGACALLGERPPEVTALLQEAEKASVFQGVRLREGAIVIPPKVRGHVPDRLAAVEDIVGLPVHTQIAVWSAQGTPGVEDDRFLAAARSVQSLFDACGNIIYWAP